MVIKMCPFQLLSNEFTSTYVCNQRDFSYLLAYQVMSNHSEPQTIWFDNSQLKSLPLNSSTGDSDVILIDDDDSDDDDDFIENNNGGLSYEPSDNSGDQKIYSCDICHSKLSSSYNLKRHMMIHTGIKLQKAKPRDLQGYLTGNFFLHSN